MVLILLLTAALRLHALRAVPPGTAYDELINADQIARILDGDLILYSTTDFGREPFYHYLGAGAAHVFGLRLFAMRAAAGLCGLMLVALGYALARRLFGVRVALLAAVGMAAGFVPLYWSRVGLRIITPTPFIAFCAYALWRGLNLGASPSGAEGDLWSASGSPVGEGPGMGRGEAFWFAAGGAALGAAMYTYIAARVLPAALLAFVIYLVLFHREAVRAHWRGVALFFMLGAVVAAPLVVFLLQHPELEQRTAQLGGVLASLRAGDVGPLMRNIWASMTAFIRQGQTYWLYNIWGRPFFPLPVALLFYAGLALAVWRWQRPAYALVLLLFFAGMAPDMLSDGAPSFVHIIDILPVVWVFPALSAAWLGRRFSGRISAALILLGAALYAGGEVYAYFVTWANHPEARAGYAVSTLEAARYLETHPEIENAALSGPGVDYWNPWETLSLDLTLRRELPARWFNGASALLVPGGAGNAWYLVLETAPVAPLWEAYFAGAQRVEQVQDFTGVPLFTVYRMPAEARSAARQALLEMGEGADCAARLGDVLALAGCTPYAETYRPGEVLRFQTAWEVRASAGPLLVFVHLLDAEGALRATWDDLDVSPAHWRAGDVFALEHALPLPADLPAGTYTLTLGAYSPETEVRLRLPTGADRVTLAPVWVGP